jgi:hypothetical protein
MHTNFYKDPVIRFDITKLQSALAEVDKRVARQSPLGERDINAICLTQIPGDPNSITGGNVRGLFWTKIVVILVVTLSILLLTYIAINNS